MEDNGYGQHNDPVVTITGEQKAGSVTISPGEQIFVKKSENKYNSCGLSGTGRFNDEKVGITAGHCGNTGQEVFNSDMNRVGVIMKSGLEPGPSQVDWAIISLEDDVKVNDSNKYTQDVPAKGDNIGFNGNVTKSSTGKVLENGSIAYSLSAGESVVSSKGIMTDAKVHKTDSGSPVKDDTGEIVGLVSAGTTSGDYGNGLMIFTEWRAITKSVDLMFNRPLTLGQGV